MTIEVTESIIRTGKRHCRHCPIALAIRYAIYRATGRRRHVSVSQYYVRTGRRHFPTPARAVRFIRRFDQSLPVKPFTFDLEIPL